MSLANEVFVIPSQQSPQALLGSRQKELELTWNRILHLQ